MWTPIRLSELILEIIWNIKEKQKVVDTNYFNKEKYSKSYSMTFDNKSEDETSEKTSAACN